MIARECWGRRERAMPLVPKPLEDTILEVQAMAFGLEPAAKRECKFFPSLDIRQYMKSLGEEKETELSQRADRLSRRAIQNQHFKSSEFCWEVCAWNDVFALILDHQSLRIDKRPYEYVESTDTNTMTVKTRIPDATLGLRSCEEFFLERGYTCSIPDCKDDHSNKQPDKRLSKVDLCAMMHNSECGLVVDGLWGEADVLFPFAVYEAKKKSTSIETAQWQIYHACKVYLAMLDDLARNPDDITEYQTEGSHMHQMFAFVGCGALWQVYVAWSQGEDCVFEMMWQGDIKDFSCALQLICIVDQIQGYAVNEHRNYVMKHLEAWHARHRRFTLPDVDFAKLAHEEHMPESGNKVVKNNVSSWFNARSLRLKVHERAEWFSVKGMSRWAKKDKIQESRRLHRDFREFLSILDAQKLDAQKKEEKQGRGGQPRAGIAKKAGVAKKEAPRRRSQRLKKRSS